MSQHVSGTEPAYLPAYTLNHAERDGLEALQLLGEHPLLLLLIEQCVTTPVELRGVELQHALFSLPLAQHGNDHADNVRRALRRLTTSAVRTQDKPLSKRAVAAVLGVIRDNAYLHRLMHSNIAGSHATIVRSLVRLGLSSNGRPAHCTDTHLETAVKFNTSQACLEALLLDPKHACLQHRNAHGHTLLHTAVLRFRYSVVETLLNVPGFPVNAKDNRGATALATVLQHYTSSAQSADIVMPLLRRCADLDLQCIVPRGALTRDDGFPLLCAAAANDLAVFQAMLRHGTADVNQCTSNELCVLAHVCETADSTDMLELLLAHDGLDPNSTGPSGMGVLPLLHLIMRKQLPMLRLLLAHPDCDPWTPTFARPVMHSTQAYTLTFWQPLDYVCTAPPGMTEAEAVAIARLLVRHPLTNLGANLALHERLPRALHRAVRANLGDLVNVLLAYGADVTLPYDAHRDGAAGRTPLALATQRGCDFAPLLQQVAAAPYHGNTLATAVHVGLPGDAEWQLRHCGADRTNNAVANLPANLHPVLNGFRQGWQPYAHEHWAHHAQFRAAVRTVLLLVYWTRRPTNTLPDMPVEMMHLVCMFLNRTDWRDPIIIHPVDDDSEDSSSDDESEIL